MDLGRRQTQGRAEPEDACETVGPRTELQVLEWVEVPAALESLAKLLSPV